MHLLATEAGDVARATLDVLTAGAVNADSMQRLAAAVRGRLQDEHDRIGLEALDLFERDPARYRLPLLVILANKANQDPAYRAHLWGLVYAARG